MRYKVSGAIAIPKASWGCAPALPNRTQLVFPRALFHMKQKTLLLEKMVFSVRQKGVPPLLLPACVLLAGDCVVQITFQSFLDFSFSEFFMFSKRRTAFTNFF